MTDPCDTENIDPYDTEEIALIDFDVLDAGDHTEEDRIIRGRKEHTCSYWYCKGPIRKGERHRYARIETEVGSVKTARICATCLQRFAIELCHHNLN